MEVDGGDGDDPGAQQRTEGGAEREAQYRWVASAAERLSTRDFAELTGAELTELAALMSRLAVATPPRRSRRSAPGVPREPVGSSGTPRSRPRS